MKSNYIMVTPEMAASWLKSNRTNRNVSPLLVSRYADAMRKGEWQENNGETLKFDATGNLLDGQHRLNALLEAGVQLKFLVISDIPTSSFKTIDIGKPRTAADIVSIAGVQNAHAIASAASFLHYLVQGKSPGGSDAKQRPSKNSILDFVQNNNDGLQRSLAITRGAGGMMMSVGLSTALHFAFASLSSRPGSVILADQFFAQLGSGVFDDRVQIEKHPAYKLRERLIADRGARLRPKTYITAAIAIKAWNAYVESKPVSLLRWRDDEEWPVIK